MKKLKQLKDNKTKVRVIRTFQPKLKYTQFVNSIVSRNATTNVTI